MKKRKKQKNRIPVYITLALAENAKRDKNINTTHPSEENVEQTREWSKENKL